ncbi:maleylpyruvate isomerase N-terminal domain-containing protein [Amycolatopsis keratiniphila]|uniref:Mycothiol-dependent maleylpyruvate isomerase n=1 Tax=Amycolatopsis keratiniphila TaxID=129921 RepID=R4TEJ6_9PSEU|nr:maleylpyruvate isomerase N-terminal domain-containing protein [Amycolatopsis keratiniphila]AGM08798.1 mycothiol-dependent maleylpyruvate isomerase [Amycolatopsis keratiniphila]
MTASSATYLEWMRAGTERLLGIVDGLAEPRFAEPSPLPGWTVGHLVAHLHYNACALGRLASWAATGVESPMYDGAGQREREISTGAALPPAELKDLVRESAAELDGLLSALTDKQWARQVVTAQGRTVSAEEIPWLRVREVVVHGVDLGGTWEWPEELLRALDFEIVEQRLARGQAAALAGVLTGRSRESLPPWL